MWAGYGGGVVVFALLLGALYRWAAAPRRGGEGRRKVTTAATSALLVGVVVASAAAGRFFAERPEGEGYPLAAGIVMGGGVALLLLGAALRAGAARMPDIHVAGVRGRAYVRAVRRADAKSIHGLPVFEIDMDASGPDIAPFRVVALEAVPERMGETIRAGATWPVLIDVATKRVTIDWVSPPPVFDEDLTVPPPPPSVAPSTQPVVEGDQPLASGGAQSAGTRTLALVLVMAMLGTGASFVSAIFQRSTPGIELEADADLRPRVGAFFDEADTGFTVELPPGWSGGESEQGLALRSGAASIDVERSPRLERTLRRADGLILRLFDAVEADLRTLERSEDLFIGTDPAMRYDLEASGGSRTTLVVVARLGFVYVVRLVAPEEGWEEASGALEDVVDSWIWAFE